MNKLNELYNDKAMLEDLRNLFNIVIEEQAVKKVLAREDVSGIADANDIVTKAFDRLDEMFKPEKKVKQENNSL